MPDEKIAEVQNARDTAVQIDLTDVSVPSLAYFFISGRQTLRRWCGGCQAGAGVGVFYRRGM